MYGILSNFIYWVNCYILSFSDGITIPQYSLLLHTFSWDLGLLSVLRKWRWLSNKNHPYVFLCNIAPCNNADNFLLQDSAILLFLHLESLIELCFSQFESIFEIWAEHIYFSLIFKIFRANVGLFFTNIFQSSIFIPFQFLFLFINVLLFETLSRRDSFLHNLMQPLPHIDHLSSSSFGFEKNQYMNHHVQNLLYDIFNTSVGLFQK